MTVKRDVPGEVPKPVALIQLCHKLEWGGYSCLLLHIAHTGIPPTLHALLTSQVPRNGHPMFASGSAAQTPHLLTVTPMHG